MAREQVFNTGDRWWQHAIVGATDDNLTYAIGYHQAANALVKVALAEHQMDLFFFPICFLYRHALELSLKELVREADRLVQLLVQGGTLEKGRLDKLTSLDRLVRVHKLEPLFAALMQRLKLVDGEEFPPYVKTVIGAFHDFDATGQVFRYAALTNGKASLPTQEQYDLVQLRDAADATLEFLINGTESWLDARIESAMDSLQYLGF